MTTVAKICPEAAALAAHLGVEPEILASLPVDLLNEGMTEMKLSAKDKTAIFLHTHSPAVADPSTTLAQHFAEESLRKRQPWRNAQAEFNMMDLEARTMLAADGVECWKTLKATFESKVKAQLLTPLEVLACQYLLYCPDADTGRFLFAHLLLCVPPTKRVSLHNWRIFDDLPQTMKLTHGAAVEKMSNPLFPSVKALDALNETLLSQALEMTAVGGGTRTKSLYAPRAATTMFDEATGQIQSTTPYGAGYPLPVVDKDGIQTGVADLGVVEAHFDALAARIQQLEQRDRSRGGFRGRGRGQAESFSGRGYGDRGRGRGRGYTPYGAGAAESEFFAATSATKNE